MKNKRPSPRFAAGSVSALLEEGMSAQRRGDLAAAERAYQRVLTKEPGHPDALHLSGVVARQRGDLTLAIERIREAVARAPEVAVYHTNLGRALDAAGDTAGCIAALERAVELDPSLLPAVYNLGLAYESSGDLVAAEEHYRWAAEDDAGVPEAAFNLGNLLLGRGRVSEAIAAYERAVGLRPEYPRALANLGFALQKAGRFDDAAEAYRAILALEPDDPEARHMVAALSGEARERADADYVARFFDDYAARFEAVLVGELGYDTPTAIAAAVRRAAPPGGRFARALDLGCGTGLAGRAIRDQCDVLIGVDLSPNMLERARAAGGYDALHAADLLGFLSSGSERFDLVVASDVLNYLGALDETFALVAARSEPGAPFVFSTEAAASGAYQLDRTGRFQHGRAYIEELAARHRFEIASCEDKTLRMERGQPVHGHLFVLRAPRG